MLEYEDVLSHKSNKIINYYIDQFWEFSTSDPATNAININTVDYTPFTMVEHAFYLYFLGGL